MEITKKLEISDEDRSFIELHSFLNVLSALISTCFLIEMDLGKPGALKENVSALEEMIKELRRPEEFIASLKSLDSIQSRFFAHLEEILAIHQTAENRDRIQADRENLHSIFKVATVRAKELLERAELDSEWQHLSLQAIEQSFTQFFGAVEKNSNGRYRIVNNIAAQTGGDYLVHMTLASADQETIFCPCAITDVMRDLIANARKYTEPGGTIDAGLEETATEIRFAVRDSGQGIPETEVERVVDYGYRASNAARKRTLGGGFGLTKAYQFVKRYGGRFWIDSVENRGTTVRFTIPKPTVT